MRNDSEPDRHEHDVTARFPHEKESLSKIRRWVREELKDRSQEDRDTVTLLATELATNTVIHCPHDLLEITLRHNGVLRLEVHDRCAHVVRAQHPDEWQTSGRGLLIVDRLADRWGTLIEDDGKRVWCELPSTETVTVGGCR